VPEGPTGHAGPNDDWVYYRIAVPPGGAGDPLLRGVVIPALARLAVPRATDGGGLRWFFLRFLDATGLHVRLRLATSPSRLSEVEAVLDDELTRTQREPMPLCTGYAKGLYAPETWKFGTGPALYRSEALFQATSELALTWLLRGGGSRVGVAAAHLAQLVSGLPVAQQVGFLHQYAWYWSGGPALPSGAARSGPNRPPENSQGSRILEQADRVTADPTLDAALGRCTELFWGQDGVGVTVLPSRRVSVLFDHIHLANNRLGVFPRAEATIARALWGRCAAGGP
jgi:hypothetical protein